MSVEEIKTRFRAEIDRRAIDDLYIDSNEEREILQIALQLGIDRSVAQTALADVCEAEGYVLESAILKAIREKLEIAVEEDGKIAQRAFDQVLLIARSAARGKRTERQIKTLIVQVMEDTGNNRVQTRWFRDWYAALKRDLGM